MSEERAVVFDGAVRLIRRARPVLAADEALIRLRMAGVCNTDLELIAGYQGFSGVLGHEFVGDVIAGPAEWIGQRVVGQINIGCGRCDYCQRGVPEHCRDRRVLGIANYDGAFADSFRLVTRNLLAVPQGMPDEVAVFTEPLAAAGHILDQVLIRPTDRVVVIGAGKLGLLVAQVLRLTGADLTVIVRHERQAALLAGWGIRAAWYPEVAATQADIVVDCTGTAPGFAAAVALVRPRGTLVLKSTYTGPTQLDLSRLVVHEVTIVGSRCGPFAPALRWLAAGLIDVTPLIEARYALDDVAEALAHAARPGALKILLVP